MRIFSSFTYLLNSSIILANILKFNIVASERIQEGSKSDLKKGEENFRIRLTLLNLA